MDEELVLGAALGACCNVYFRMRSSANVRIWSFEVWYSGTEHSLGKAARCIGGFVNCSRIASKRNRYTIRVHGAPDLPQVTHTILKFLDALRVAHRTSHLTLFVSF